jgi:hypothetical protein
MVGREENIPIHLERIVADLRKESAYEQLVEIGALSPVIYEETENAQVQRASAHPARLAESKPASEEERIREDGLTATRAWWAARGQLQTELSKATFDTWVRDVEMLGFSDGTFTLGAANDYAREWLDDRLKSIVERVMTGIVGKPVRVRFDVIDPKTR